MAEGEEANFFHGHKADVSRLALSNPKLGLEQAAKADAVEMESVRAATAVCSLPLVG
jgi:hypothetical protein